MAEVVAEVVAGVVVGVEKHEWKSELIRLDITCMYIGVPTKIWQNTSR